MARVRIQMHIGQTTWPTERELMRKDDSEQENAGSEPMPLTIEGESPARAPAQVLLVPARVRILRVRILHHRRRQRNREMHQRLRQITRPRQLIIQQRACDEKSCMSSLRTENIERRFTW